MYCRKCGTQNDDNAYKCVQCGEILQQVAGAGMPAQASGLAIGSLVSSIAGLVACLFVGQIVGIVLGHKAKRQIRESNGRFSGDGFATAGIIIGWVGIAIDIMLVVFWSLFGFASFFAAL